MSRRSRSIATLLAAAGLVVVGLSPAASAQSLMGSTGSTGSVGALGLESAPIPTPAIPGLSGVLTIPVPAPERRQAETTVASVDNAGDSQALIQLKREYCDKKECLRCRFGYEYLKGKKKSEE